MKLAKDGKPYDIVNISEVEDNEVEIIQYLRPAGRRRLMTCLVGEDLKKMARDHIISAEVLRTGEIAIYIRKKGEPAESEHLAIAYNGPGPNNPQKVLKRLIKKHCSKGG
jgi:hypothetical protein